LVERDFETQIYYFFSYMQFVEAGGFGRQEMEGWKREVGGGRMEFGNFRISTVHPPLKP
jgi:hypothetical protein